MEKLDRLGWAGGICFRSYGLKIGVRVNDPRVLERVAACLPLGWEPVEGPGVDYLFSLRVGGPRPGGRVRDFHLLYVGAGRAARSLELDEVYDVLESELQLFVGEWAHERVFVHAGVVGWRGQAILVPGRSGSGKSTLVAELLRAGASYYSDEYAVLDAQGYVHPYARRLSLRQRGGGPPRRCSAAELGGQAGVEPLPVALVAATRYQAGARWQPRLLGHGKAVLELMDNTLPARVYPERALAALEQVVSRSRNVKGVRGEAREMVDALLREADR